MRQARTLRSTHGFTLVEILVVVVILAILAAIVLPQFSFAISTVGQTALVTDLNHYGRQAQVYMAETGQLLEDAGTGQVPAGFENYISVADWENGSPIGGEWDTESFGVGGHASSLGVHFIDGGQPDDAYMTEIDEMIDDGDLTTGRFQEIDDDRFYTILAE